MVQKFSEQRISLYIYSGIMLTVTLVIMIIMMIMVLLMDDLTILSVHLTIIGRLPNAHLCRVQCGGGSWSS